MPFSQQSYTGQGIVQQNVTPRAGEIIGASLANMGQSIGAGIEKFAQRKEEAKALRKELGLLKSFVPKEGRDQYMAEVEAGSLADLIGMKKGMLQQAAMEHQQLENRYLQAQLGQAQRGLQQGLAEDAFRIGLMGGQSAGDAARGVANETGMVPDSVFKQVQSSQQGDIYSKALNLNVPPGTDLGTAQAVQSAQEQLDAAALSKRNTESLIAAREAQMQADQRKHKQELDEQAARGNLTPEQAKMSADMFDKLRASQPVKNMSLLNAQYQALENLVNNTAITKDGKLDGAGDIAIVFSFMKSLDPQSTVREGEFQTASQVGGLVESFINQANKMKDGSFLKPETRRKFLATARQAAEGFVSAANAERDAYVQQGARFSIPEQYAAGNPFSLRRQYYESSDDLNTALQNGELKSGSRVKVLMNGEYVDQLIVEE